MPTETYHEEAKGVSRIWYVHKERLARRPGINIYQETYERVRETIERNGLAIPTTKFTSQETIPGVRIDYKVYSVCNATILISDILLRETDSRKICDCPQHAIPRNSLTITANNLKVIDDVAKKLNLPLEARIK